MHHKWEIIFDYLVYLIRENKIKTGEILPSQNRLKTKFKCSEQPVREAYKKLIELQLVQAVSGKGFVVRPKAENNNLFSFRELYPNCVNQYSDLQTIVITEDLTEKTKMMIGQKAWRFKCKRISKDQQVILIQDSIVPYHFFKSLNLDYLNEYGLMKYIETKCPTKISHALKNIYFETNFSFDLKTIFNDPNLVGTIVDQGYLYTIYGEIMEFRTSYYNPKLFNWKFIEWRN